jgi:hypothetical protein
MSAQVTITQLPTAGTITGSELVPIVQNGQTVQTTTGAISSSPNQTQTFLTLNQEPTLANSRALSGGTGVGLVDGGAQSTLQVYLNGVSGSLETSSDGIIAKSSGSVTGRTLSTSGSGLSVSNGNGVSGNPTFQLTGIAAAIANASGTGMLAIVGGSTIAGRQIIGTTNQINVTDGNGSGNPTLSIANNLVMPGTEGVTIPIGTTAERPSPATNGELRYNTDTETFEGYANGAWGSITTGTGVTSVGLVLPSQFTVTNSPVTSTGDLTATWASQTANYMLAAPNGSAGTPSFRAMVNADLPASGVTANTYGSTTAIPVITVNAKGVITGVTTATITGGLVYQGSWNASTNTPTLASGVGTNGYYYIVSVAGTTNLDGITDWQVGDWAIFNGTSWQKIDQTNLVSSVNGQTGAVSIAYADLAGAIPTWNQNTTGTAAGLSTTLAIGSGGTGQTTAGAAFNALSPITSTGDLIIGNGTNSATRLGIGSNGYLLTSNGTTATWAAAPAAGVTSFSAGTTGFTPSTGTTGDITLSGTLGVASGGTNLTSYTSGDLLYASGTTTISKLGIGTTNYVLTAGASAPQYVAQSTLSVGTATNLAGGIASQIPYQTSAGSTSFIANGTAGQVLTSAGTGAPTWSGISGGTF